MGFEATGHSSDEPHDCSASRPVFGLIRGAYRRDMKAILQATLAAVLSGALVGWLLSKKVESVTKS
jgi:hypothetical protein